MHNAAVSRAERGQAQRTISISVWSPDAFAAAATPTHMASPARRPLDILRHGRVPADSLCLLSDVVWTVVLDDGVGD